MSIIGVVGEMKVINGTQCPDRDGCSLFRPGHRIQIKVPKAQV